MIFPQVLCSLTTHSSEGYRWQDKLLELREIELLEFALFLTGLKIQERYELYRELLSMKAEYRFQIPFVHARSDMSDDEYYFLQGEFGTEAFNLHPVRDYPLLYPLSKGVKSKIYVENATLLGGDLLATDIEGYAGICFDLSHCEDERLRDKNAYEHFLNLSLNFKVGANHVSSVPINSPSDLSPKSRSQHFFSNLEAFDYLRNYSADFIGPYCAIELEDPISVHLRVKPYIERCIQEIVFDSLAKKVA